MRHPTETLGTARSGARMARTDERPVYFISDRPEAYEVWGEVGHDEAIDIARLIAERAGRKFPGIEFRVDHGWHEHLPGMEKVSSYIEDHWQGWVRSGRSS